jgi:peptidoglycan/xylan/chitin deacetylase (PgdA/CDA1 family)
MPRAHWALLGVQTILIMLFLLLSGLVNGEVGESAHDPSSRAQPGQVPPAVRGGGPIIDPVTSEATGGRISDRHVVLTFDDGPSRWTEEILDILAARGVKATFFVVGARAADRPDLVRRMYLEGHDVGVHTFTHVNLANVSTRRLQLELDQTQLAIAAAIGQTTNLLRLPYSSEPEAVLPSDWQAMKKAQNYRVVFTDLDTADWAKPGVAKIVQAGLPNGDRGAVVMLHDGGGSFGDCCSARRIDHSAPAARIHLRHGELCSQHVAVASSYHVGARAGMAAEHAGPHRGFGCLDPQAGYCTARVTGGCANAHAGRTGATSCPSTGTGEPRSSRGCPMSRSSCRPTTSKKG